MHCTVLYCTVLYCTVVFLSKIQKKHGAIYHHGHLIMHICVISQITPSPPPWNYPRVECGIYPEVDSRFYLRVDPVGSQNLPLPPRIYPLFVIWWGVFWSQNLPLDPRLYPPFQQIYTCDSYKIYPTLQEYTSLFSNYIIIWRSHNTDYSPTLFYNYMRPFQNVPLPHRLHHPPPFSTTIWVCITLI